MLWMLEIWWDRYYYKVVGGVNSTPAFIIFRRCLSPLSLRKVGSLRCSRNAPIVIWTTYIAHDRIEKGSQNKQAKGFKFLKGCCIATLFSVSQKLHSTGIRLDVVCITIGELYYKENKGYLRSSWIKKNMHNVATFLWLGHRKDLIHQISWY